MKKVLKKFNRTLSIMLAAAMVLTMVPQTAMPVLAAENQDIDEYVDEPAVDESTDVEKTVEAPESGESEEVTEPSDEGNPEEITDDISNEDPSDEDAVEEEPSEEEDPVAEEPSEEEVADPTVEEDDLSNSIMSDLMEETEPLTEPKVTLKLGENTLVPDEDNDNAVTVPNRSEIALTIEGESGADFYYELGDTKAVAPAETDGNKYTAGSAKVDAPNQNEAITKYLNVIAVKPAEGETPATKSAVVTYSITYEKKVNTIKLAQGSSEDAVVKIGDDTITSTAVYDIKSTSADIYVDVDLADATAKKEITKVEYKASDAENFTEAAISTANNANKGKYKIPKTALTNDLELKVEVKPLKKITVKTAEGGNFDMFTVAYKVMKGSTTLVNQKAAKLAEIADAEQDNGNYVIYVSNDKKVELTFAAATKCSLATVTYADDDAGSEEGEEEEEETTPTVGIPVTPDKNKNYKITIASITKDQVVTVTADEEYLKAVVTKVAAEGEEAVEVPYDTKAKAYNVEPRTDYTISAVKGGKGAFDIKRADFTDKAMEEYATLVSSKATPETPEGTEEQVADNDPTTWTLQLSKEANNKTIKVDLFGADDNKVDTLTFKVAAVTTEVKVTGAGTAKTGDKEYTITQTVGTVKEYTLTRVPASNDSLAVQIKQATTSSNVDAVIDEDTGKLVVTAKTAEKADVAGTYEIINDSDKEGSKAVLATVVIKTTAPAWNGTATPNASQTNSTDIEAVLSMSLPQVAAPLDEDASDNAYKYYYEVKTKVTKNDTNITPYEAVGKDDYTARYYKVDNPSKALAQKVTLFGGELGAGGAATFGAEVRLIQVLVATDQQADETYADGSLKDTPQGTIIATSKPKTLTLTTKTPYYAEKLTLKKTKAASGVYTGQKDIPVATVDFGKNTTYNRDVDVEVEIVEFSGSTTATDNNVTAKISEGQILVSVGKNVKAQKYTVKVTQSEKNGAGLYDKQARLVNATLPITVVQGINTIDASAQSTIYVADTNKKKVNAKITTVYNKDGVKPKTAKAAYAVGAVDENGDYLALDSDSITDTQKAIGNVVTVNQKNGTVTVDAKKYNELGENPFTEFAVQVSAADYEPNTAATPAIVKFEIVTSPQTLGKIVLLQEKEISQQADEDVKTYEVVGSGNTKNTNSITADEVGKTYVRVLDEDAEIGEDNTVKSTDLVPTDRYNLTFSNKKDISLKNDCSIDVTKMVQNVTVSAKTTDGGNKSVVKANQLVFTVDYEAVDSEKVKLQTLKKVGDTTYADLTTTPTEVEGYATGAVIPLQAVVTGESNTVTPLSGKIVDYKIVAGSKAKIVPGSDNLTVGLVMSGKDAKVKLVSQNGKQTYAEYTITNVNFDKVAVPGVKADKSPYANYGSTQDITYTFAKVTKQADIDGLSTAAKVRITAASDDVSQKLLQQISEVSSGSEDDNDSDGTENQAEGDATEKIIALNGDVKFDKTTQPTVTLQFAAGLDPVKKATLYFDLLSEDGTIISKTSKAVTVKTATFKKSYKLNGKYTMSAKDKASVPLTASGKPVGVDTDKGVNGVEFKKLLNANIKGQINKFAEAFTLEVGDDNEKTGVLKLVHPDMAIKDKSVNNLTGFVEYTVHFADGDSKTETVQLTITMKDAVQKKLTADTVSVIAEQNMSVTTTVKAGKAPVELAVVEYVGKDDIAENLASTAIDAQNNGNVTLTLAENGNADAIKGKTLKGTLYVVPADSYYADDAKKLFNKTDDDANEASLLADGTEDKPATWDAFKATDKVYKVDVTINVKDGTVAANNNRVKLSTTKPNFSRAEVNTNGDYNVEIPYSYTIAAQLTSKEGEAPVETVYTEQKNDTETVVTPAWIKIAKAEDDAITVSFNRADYVAWLNAGNLSKNGKTVNATVQFNFADNVKQQIKLTVTLPKLVDELKVAISIEPVEENGKLEVAPNGNLELKAVVTKDGEAVAGNDAEVEWKIVSTVANDTAFDSSTKNKLTVAAGETAKTITVRATSTSDACYKLYGEATITVKDTTAGGEEGGGEEEGSGSENNG
ncbi:MAG: hypothetical protein HDR16_07855 [Lachnospiraceae bacterium]|nr:hypothetical protein [Lachnospiraceae bacterium]